MKTRLSRLSIVTLSWLSPTVCYHLDVPGMGMSKKKKKIFKKVPTLAPKVVFNHKVTVWRQPESKHLYARTAKAYHTLLLNSLQDSTVTALVASRLQELR